MIFKPEVVTAGVIPQIWYAVGMADAAKISMGLGQVTVCAMRDGQHKPGSLHYEGRAVDLRDRDISPEQAHNLFVLLRAWLYPMGFDVLLEQTPLHLHIEYDPKPGRAFPAPTYPAAPATAVHA